MRTGDLTRRALAAGTGGRDVVRVVSVQVGRPRPLAVAVDRTVLSSIRKAPVEGVVLVGPEGLGGDQQADRRVHGGPRKAVYAYPVEHYAFWRGERPELEFPPGAFGENLTVEGLTEPDVRPGDRLAIGSAVLSVTQPRFPCFKLGARFERPTFLKEFADAGRPGFYLTVERTGELRAGDPIRFEATGPAGPSIAEIFRARLAREPIE